MRKGFLEEVTLELSPKKCSEVSQVELFVKALRARLRL